MPAIIPERKKQHREPENKMSSLFTKFLSNPGKVGAFCASSRALAVEMTRHIGMENAGTVVELGPGTGAITCEIIPRLAENSKFIAVELDEEMAENIRARFPRASVSCGCASNLSEILNENGCTHTDIIISGLPWAIFPEKLQEEILGAVFEALPPGGKFATFAYIQGVMLPAGIRFRRRLENLFSKVESSHIIWRNLPPAFVYRCQK